MNTLANRIKYVKQELTNLKTAHERGLGMVKIYSYNYGTPPVPATGNFIVNINFNTDFASYPMFQIGPTLLSVSSGSYWFGLPNARYTNNGYTAIVTMPQDFAEFYRYSSLRIACTSPISSVTYGQEARWTTILILKLKD